MRLPEVPLTYTPEVERERNRTLEIEAKQYARSEGTISGADIKSASANYSASDRDYVLTDTSGAAFTVTLPDAATGFQVIVADDGANWETNNLTVARNGNTIEGSAADLVCDVAGLEVTLVYNGSTWRVFV